LSRFGWNAHRSPLPSAAQQGLAVEEHYCHSEGQRSQHDRADGRNHDGRRLADCQFVDGGEQAGGGVFPDWSPQGGDGEREIERDSDTRSSRCARHEIDEDVFQGWLGGFQPAERQFLCRDDRRERPLGYLEIGGSDIQGVTIPIGFPRPWLSGKFLRQSGRFAGRGQLHV
jgi:hypothetical protein